MNADEKIQFNNMQDKIDKIDDKVDDILQLLKGDEFGNSAGLVSEVKELKARMRKMENLKSRIIWIVTGAGIAGGFAFDKILDFLKKVIPLLLCMLFLSGCSMFKNVRKQKHSEKSKTEITERAEASSVETGNVNADISSVTHKDITTDTGVEFQVEGNVKVHPDGTVTGDRVHGRINQQKQENENTSTNTKLTGQSEKQSQSSGEKKRKQEYQSGESETVSTVSWKTIIAVAVGLAVIALIIYMKIKSLTKWRL